MKYLLSFPKYEPEDPEGFSGYPIRNLRILKIFKFS